MSDSKSPASAKKKGVVTKNVQIVCRVRPPLGSEDGEAVACQPPDQLVVEDLTHGKRLTFGFDGVFDTDVQQKEIFALCGVPALRDVLRGYNVTLMTYGQTGSGKTYTMEGSTFALPGLQKYRQVLSKVKSQEQSPDLHSFFQPIAQESKETQQGWGLVPRLIGQLYTQLEGRRQQHPEANWQVHASFLELYRGRLVDCLRDPSEPSVSPIRLHRLKNKTVRLMGHTTRPAESVQQLVDIYREGLSRRVVASTKQNPYSSRGHAVFDITITCVHSGKRRQSMLRLMDLAGSEQPESTAHGSDEREEAKAINTSLSFLGKVVQSLSQKQSFVNYRLCPLTRLMEQSLTGSGSRVCMLVTCAPNKSNVRKTINTLRFASQATSVELVFKEQSWRAPVPTVSDMRMPEPVAAPAPSSEGKLDGMSKTQLISLVSDLQRRLDSQVCAKCGGDGSGDPQSGPVVNKAEAAMREAKLNQQLTVWRQKEDAWKAEKAAMKSQLEKMQSTLAQVTAEKENASREQRDSLVAHLRAELVRAQGKLSEAQGVVDTANATISDMQTQHKRDVLKVVTELRRSRNTVEQLRREIAALQEKVASQGTKNKRTPPAAPTLPQLDNDPFLTALAEICRSVGEPVPQGLEDKTAGAVGSPRVADSSLLDSFPHFYAAYCQERENSEEEKSTKNSLQQQNGVWGSLLWQLGDIHCHYRRTQEVILDYVTGLQGHLSDLRAFEIPVDPRQVEAHSRVVLASPRSADPVIKAILRSFYGARSGFEQVRILSQQLVESLRRWVAHGTNVHWFGKEVHYVDESVFLQGVAGADSGVYERVEDESFWKREQSLPRTRKKQSRDESYSRDSSRVSPSSQRQSERAQSSRGLHPALQRPQSALVRDSDQSSSRLFGTASFSANKSRHSEHREGLGRTASFGTPGSGAERFARALRDSERNTSSLQDPSLSSRSTSTSRRKHKKHRKHSKEKSSRLAKRVHGLSVEPYPEPVVGTRGLLAVDTIEGVDVHQEEDPLEGPVGAQPAQRPRAKQKVPDQPTDLRRYKGVSYMEENNQEYLGDDDETRAAVAEYLSGLDLFRSIPGKFGVTGDEIDELLFAARGLRNTLRILRRLDEQGADFKEWDDLVRAVITEEARKRMKMAKKQKKKDKKKPKDRKGSGADVSVSLRSSEADIKQDDGVTLSVQNAEPKRKNKGMRKYASVSGRSSKQKSKTQGFWDGLRRSLFGGKKKDKSGQSSGPRPPAGPPPQDIEQGGGGDEMLSVVVEGKDGNPLPPQPLSSGPRELPRPTLSLAINNSHTDPQSTTATPKAQHRTPSSGNQVMALPAGWGGGDSRLEQSVVWGEHSQSTLSSQVGVSAVTPPSPSLVTHGDSPHNMSTSNEKQASELPPTPVQAKPAMVPWRNDGDSPDSPRLNSPPLPSVPMLNTPVIRVKGKYDQ